MAPVTQETVFPAGSRHRVVCPNSVVKLRRNQVWLETEFEGQDVLDFEMCILATGAQSPAPIRPMPCTSLEEWQEALVQSQQDIAAAQSVLIVGGGSCGIEVAGEITDMYPHKKVTIVHWDVGLLHPSDSGGNTRHTYVPPKTSQKLSNALESQLTSRGVRLILKDRVDLESAKKPGQWGGQPGPLPGLCQIPLVSGRIVEADYVFNPTGNRPNASLVAFADPGALTTNGYVSVDPYFRVRPGTQESPLGGQYYAIGDVSNTPGWKTAIAGIAEGEALAVILGDVLRGQRPQPYQRPSHLRNSTVLLGSKGGAAIMRLPIIGNIRTDWVVKKKDRDFHAGTNFFARFRGAHRIAPTIPVSVSTLSLNGRTHLQNSGSNNQVNAHSPTAVRHAVAPRVN